MNSLNKIKKFTFFFATAFLFACNNEDSETEKLKELALQNNFNIEFLNQGQVFFGDTLQIKIVSKNELNIQEINIFSDNQLLKKSEKSELFFLDTKQLGGGEKQIVIFVKYKDGKEKSETKNIIVLRKNAPELYTFEVIKTYPHDATSYTQGLEFYKNSLIEGTGNYNQSKLRKEILINGKIEKEIKLDSQFFGEGITVFDNKIYQLTYKEKKVFVYNVNTLEKLNEFDFTSETNEGWGLTHNDTSLIFSDGSAFIYFCNPATFKITKKLKVFDQLKDVAMLNELEYHNGKLFANIYGQPFIAEINPSTGEVNAYINLTNILKPEEIKSKIDVLNGIAINNITGNLLVTGKWWPLIFEIKLKKIENAKPS